MYGAVAVAAAILIVAVLAVVSYRRRIRRLETELDEVYQAQQILQRARDRKHRSHLHLLVVPPLAWLAGKMASSGARLAAASAVSVGVTGASLLAVDDTHQPILSPPADAETTVPNTDIPDGRHRSDEVSSATSIPPSVSSTVPAAAPQPPASAAGLGSEPLVPPSATAPTSTTTTSPSLASTTTSTVLLPPLEILPCLNPQGVPLPIEACP
jgi:hypothetical protein